MAERDGLAAPPAMMTTTMKEVLPSASKLLEFCNRLPKIDLHRHLSGSFRLISLAEILAKKAPELADVDFITPAVKDFDASTGWARSMRKFNAVKIAGEELADLLRLFEETIDDIAAENILYCEFRIGIKPQPTKRDYLNALISVIRKQRTKHPRTMVKLLLSVARHGEVSYASENVDLAIEYFKNDTDNVVCGIELGGVATKGSWEDFKPLFDRAREANLPVALHCGEDVNNQSEAASMIDYKPDRLGHCVFLDDDNIKKLLDSKITVEACLECHCRCYTVPYEQNIASMLLKHPGASVVLATDNPSFYDTTLSEEYVLACNHLENITPTALIRLARHAIDVSFATEAEKETLYRQFDEDVQRLVEDFQLSI